MSAATIAGIGALGGLGAVARFVLDGAVSARIARVLPWGTLAVNLAGAFALGALVGAGAGSESLRLAGTGFVGAFTTFSTWMLESQRLAEDGRLRAATINVVASLALGLLAVWAGRHAGALL